MGYNGSKKPIIFHLGELINAFFARLYSLSPPFLYLATTSFIGFEQSTKPT